jgi:hypothetical protein
MKRLLVLSFVLALPWLPGAAAAAPGDFVTLTGTVQHERSNLLVLRTDDGRTVFADLRGATRPRAFRVGDAVTLAGYEGRRPDEISVAIVEPAAAGTATAGADGFHTAGGWRLPADHHYDMLEPSGEYSRIDVRDVPARIAEGRRVYDRTAKAWVNHPNEGPNPAYQAGAAGAATGAPVAGPARRFERLHGVVEGGRTTA